MKTIIGLTRDCIRYLPDKLRIKGVFIVILILVSTIVDIVGIATVLPVFGIFFSEDESQNAVIRKLSQFLGDANSGNGIVITLLIICAILIGKTIFVSFSNYIQGKYIYSIYRHYVNQKYLSIFFRADRKPGRGSASDQVKADLYLLPRVFANQLTTSLLSFIAEVFILLLIVSILLIFNWRIVVVLLATLVPMMWLFYLAIRRQNQTVDFEIHRFLPRIAKHVGVAFFGNLDIRLSKSFNHFHGAFDEDVQNESKLLNLKLVLSKLPPLAVELVVLFAFVIMVVLSMWTGESRAELLLQVSVFGIAALKLMPSINRMMFAILNIKANIYSAEILNEDYTHLVKEMNAAEQLSFRDEIRINNGRFAYPDKSPVFSGVGLVIRKGERIGVVGESGSGKSTLLKLLMGELQLTEGQFLVDGNPLSRRDLPSWIQSIALVNQDIFILDDTIEANIAFGTRNVDPDRLRWAGRHAALEEFIESLPEKYQTPVGELGSMLSGGQRQRIGIARALYNNASLLLLDEATSALDAETEDIIKRTIQQLPPTVTIVTISHRLPFLQFCSRVYRISNGTLQQVTV